MDAAAARRVLGVQPDASPASLRRAYLQLALASHPDKGGSSEAFQRVQAAYDAASQRVAVASSSAAKKKRAAPKKAATEARRYEPRADAQAERGAGTARIFRCSCGEAFPSERRLRAHAKGAHAAVAPPKRRDSVGEDDAVFGKYVAMLTVLRLPRGVVENKLMDAGLDPSEFDGVLNRARNRSPTKTRGSTCQECGWRNCQCAVGTFGGEFDFSEIHERDAAVRRARERRAAARAMASDPGALGVRRPSADDDWPTLGRREEEDGERERPPPPDDEAKRAWFSRARDSLAERNAARYADLSPSPVFAAERRSERRVRHEQITILRDMGFSKNIAVEYADADFPLDAILDSMCEDGVEFEVSPAGGILSRLFVRLFRR